MKNPPQLWVLAGGNGAGKSTFYRLFLKPRGIKLINADLIAREIDPENPEKAGYRAAHLAVRIMEDMLEQGLSFCCETVFSHPSKVDLTARAKALGYEIILVFVHLETPALHEARVSQRVAEGGHSVPSEKIYTRLPRTLQNIAAVLPLADEARILDNSSRKNPFRQIAVIKQGKFKALVSPLPEWIRLLLQYFTEQP